MERMEVVLYIFQNMYAILQCGLGSFFGHAFIRELFKHALPSSKSSAQDRDIKSQI